MTRLALTSLLVLSLLAPALADDPPRKSGEGKDAPKADPTPKPGKDPAKKRDEEGDDDEEDDNGDLTPADKHSDALEDTVVHFDFRRAPIEDILRALSQATHVPITLGRGAQRTLEKRRFKIKYIASRRGDKVLTDLCKAAHLDFVIRDEGVLVDLPARIKKVRKELGLGGKAVRLSPEDVTKALHTKTLSMTSAKRPLAQVLRFLREETGIPFMQLSEERKKDAPPLIVTLDLTSVPLRELLDTICAPLELDWIQTGRVILLGSKKAIEEQRKARKKSADAPPKQEGEKQPKEPAPRKD